MTSAAPPPAPAVAQPAGAGTSTPEECLHCGAALDEDQEWCLECGAARTVIHPPPDWRIPLAVLGVFLLLILAAFAIALTNLSTDVNRITPNAATRRPRTRPAAPRATPQPQSTPITSQSPGGIAVSSWPVGLPGWTVSLASTNSESSAKAIATQLAAGGIQVGVLDSSAHSSMAPGHWVVFSGRYPTQAQANSAAAKLRARGNSSARATLVERPGA